METYIWIIFALLSAVSASLVAIFGKIGLQNIDSNVATGIRAVIMALFLFGVIVVQGKLSSVPDVLSNKNAMIFIVLSGVMGAVSWIFYFLALKFGKVSQVVPIDRLSIVFAMVLALFFLSEKISLKSGIGASLITAGAILIAMG